VRTLPEALAAPEVVAREMVVTVPDSVHGTLRLLGSPLKLSDTPVRAPVAPPRLGEHTEGLRRFLEQDEDRRA
jgi:crotonobetainyl-CoA:carnitine CoA-transferase CaiB-like acyl-CoA transferase